VYDLKNTNKNLTNYYTIKDSTTLSTENIIYLNPINDILLYDIPTTSDNILSSIEIPVNSNLPIINLTCYLLKYNQNNIEIIKQFDFNLPNTSNTIKLDFPLIHIPPNIYFGFKSNVSLPFLDARFRSTFILNKKSIPNKYLNLKFNYVNSFLDGHVIYKLDIKNYTTINIFDSIIYNRKLNNFKYSFDLKSWNNFNTMLNVIDKNVLYIKYEFIDDEYIRDIVLNVDGYFTLEELRCNNIVIEEHTLNTVISSFTDKDFNILLSVM
jgi:hypothetical protein